MFGQFYLELLENTCAQSKDLTLVCIYFSYFLYSFFFVFCVFKHNHSQTASLFLLTVYIHASLTVSY